MVAAIFEYFESNLYAVRKDSTRVLKKLRTGMKEIGERKLVIDKASSTFEQTVVIEGVEKITQKIPAEKYVKFLQEWLKSAQAIVQNLRLRISTTTAQYKNVSLQLERQISFGERVQLPDIEKLEIENKVYAETIDKKNSDLLKMKFSTGRSNLLLTNSKNIMQKKLKEIEKINELIKTREKKIVNLNRECKIGTKDTENAEANYLSLKELIKSSYSVPDLIDYIKIKEELNDLEKNIKRYQRRGNLQKISMEMCINEMKHLTGLKTIQPSWLIFEEENLPDSGDGLFLDL